MDFKEVVVKRRSIRKFKREPVPENTITAILESGRWAPSAGNCQPWRFIVVTDVEIKRKIGESCTRFSRQYWKRFSPQRARYLAARGGTWDKSYMKDLPFLIVVCYEHLENMRDELLSGSVWLAVENMLLAATDEGIGSCVYTFLNKREERNIRSILHVPENFNAACMIQLGYPIAEPIAPQKKRLADIVSYQRF